MRVTTRGRYAVRAMVDLALHAEEGVILGRDIAGRQEISANYVAQLFRHLRDAGLVRAVKGPGGGYALARDAHDIRIGDIVRAVEGPLAVAECAGGHTGALCERSAACSSRLLWSRLSNNIEKYLDSVTLQDLRDETSSLIREEHNGDKNL